jgi:hypothetical protein
MVGQTLSSLNLTKPIIQVKMDRWNTVHKRSIDVPVYFFQNLNVNLEQRKKGSMELTAIFA